MALATRLRSTSHWSDPRVKPPFGGVEIDWGHPLARGLAFAFLLNERAGGVKDLVAGAPGTLSDPAALTWTTDVNGPAVNFSGVSPSIDLTAAQSRYDIPAPFSIVTWWNWQSGNKNAYAGPVKNRVASQNGFQVVDDSGLTASWVPHLVVWNGSVESFVRKGSTTQSRPFNKKFVWTWDGTTAFLYVDGVSDTVVNGQGGWASATAAVNLGGGYNTIAGDLTQVLIYRRVLSQAESLEHATLPYAFLRPILRRRYFIFTPTVVEPEVGRAQEHIGRAIGRGFFVGR